MSTARRRRGKSLHLDLSSGTPEDRPPLSALFLVQFDVKAGYTIAWKRSALGLDLHESVEFKSLPSGLHNVKEDLVYFMHGEDHAGISAFVNESTDQWERNALMLAVGALVPLEQGRLGRSWKHASELKRIASELVQDPSKTQVLEDYWDQNQPHEVTVEEDQSDSERKAPTGRRASHTSSHSRSRLRGRGKSFSSGHGAPGPGLSSYHPARSIPLLIDTFGPLVYPLYKAALLRKRILIISEAPVEQACNFVYDISIISNIPSSVAELVPLEPLPSRLQPLFSIGVHDIDELSRHVGSGSGAGKSSETTDLGYGWVACTTDDVLGIKNGLYDVLVTVPPAHTLRAKEKAWPTIKTSLGQEVKASQRDSRRYGTLRQSQRRAFVGNQGTSPYSARTGNSDYITTHDGDDDQTTLLPQNSRETFDDASSITDEQLVEPLSWSALAYNSFMWWASAGEKRSDLDEEIEHDTSMYRDSDQYFDRPGSARSRTLSGSNHSTPGTMKPDGTNILSEMAMIAYFHRLTASILERIAELVDSTDGAEAEEQGEDGDGEPKDGDEKPKVYVGSEDMIRMGLDVWSEGDRRFVEELLEFYFGRGAEVQGGRIECCGVRIV